MTDIALTSPSYFSRARDDNKLSISWTINRGARYIAEAIASFNKPLC